MKLTKRRTHFVKGNKYATLICNNVSVPRRYRESRTRNSDDFGATTGGKESFVHATRGGAKKMRGSAVSVRRRVHTQGRYSGKVKIYRLGASEESREEYLVQVFLHGENFRVKITVTV